MMRLNSEIKIIGKVTKKNVVLSSISQINITTSINTLTDTAKVVLPRNLKWKERDLGQYVSRGDEVIISLGYADELKAVFSGFVKNVSTSTPIVLECENEAYELKQQMVEAKIYDKLNLKDFCSEYIKVDQEVASVELGEVRVNGQTSVSGVLDYFIKNYPVCFFLRGGKFYGGLKSSMLLKGDESKVVNLTYGLNMISDTLEYVRADEVNYVVKAKVIMKNNSKLEYSTGGDGDVRTFLVPGAKSIGELKEYAEERLKELKVDRMTGTITLFGVPYVRKGDVVYLTDNINVERDDKRFEVVGVSYSFGSGGYRQVVALGNELK